MSKKPDVSIVIGSDSDWSFVEPAVGTLEDFGVLYEVRVISAHRTPHDAADYAAGLARRGVKVVIAGAGGAAAACAPAVSLSTLMENSSSSS